jgi:hypothetical protein
MKPPSERKLAAIERELRRLPAGSQRAVGGGVYMRLDKDRRRRFQIRTRMSDGQPAATFDSWQEARDHYELLQGRGTNGSAAHSRAKPVPAASFEMAPGPGDVIGPTHEQLRQLTFRDYRAKVYWPWAVVHLDPLGQSRKACGGVAREQGRHTLAAEPIDDRIESLLICRKRG